MWNKTKLTELIGLQYPIIQAPMAGGATTANLVAAVANAGCLGSLGAGYLAPDEISKTIKQIRELTQRVFAVNLFVPEPHVATKDQMRTACDAINQCALELNIETQPIEGPYAPSFENQIAMLLREKVPVVSFTFGIPGADIIQKFKANGTVIIGTATTLAEATALQEAGVDAIVAQSSEAGGHRGTFLDSAEGALVPLSKLLQQLIGKISLPVIASGGIMNGKKIAAVMISGAAAVQMGTAFLTCAESGIHPKYKHILLEQKQDNTTLTRAFSGKMARGINNQFIQCMQSKTDAILDYPIQNALTKIMRAKAKEVNAVEFMSLWAGQSAALCRDVSAKELINQLISETIAFFFP